MHERCDPQFFMFAAVANLPGFGFLKAHLPGVRNGDPVMSPQPIHSSPAACIWDDVPLFAASESWLPPQISPNLRERISHYLGRRKGDQSSPLMLIFDAKSYARWPDCQLPLPLAPPRRSNIVRFAPRHRYPYLDYGVYDTFRSVPEVAKAALKLEANQILLLGQLVQLSEEQVRAFSFMKEDTLRIMKVELAAMGLGFATRVPSWNKRLDSLVSVAP